jgi:uncharacterized membrane protein
LKDWAFVKPMLGVLATFLAIVGGVFSAMGSNDRDAQISRRVASIAGTVLTVTGIIFSAVTSFGE